MQKKQRRPGVASGTIPPPPPPANTNTTRLGVFWTEANNDVAFPVTAAQKQIVKDTTHTQLCTINNTGSIVGATAESTTAFASYDGLSQLDARITAMAASQRTGGDLTIVLNAAPWWMMNKPRDGNYSTVNDFTVTDANLGVWGDFCAFLLNRYWAQNVRNLVVWSEQKGYFLGGTLQRWDYVRLTAMYNAVWSACKSVQPTVKIGGPYITTRSALEHRTGIPTVASDGTSIVSNAQVLGATWHTDARQLNTVIYWLANATGYDFVCLDGSIWPSTNPATIPNNPLMAPTTAWPVGTAGTVQHVDGTVVFDDREKCNLIGDWLRAKIPASKPIWWVESYFGSGIAPAADFKVMYDSMKGGGIDMMVVWHGKNAPRVGTQLWTPSTDTRTAVGDSMAAITAVVG